MMVEKRGSIHFEEIPMAKNLTAQQKELAKGMVRVNHLYRSALKVAMTQVEILDEDFASLYDHSPIHHIEYRIKTLDSIIDKLRRRGYEVSIDNIYAHIHDVAGIRVICNYLDDIYYLRSLLTRSESFKVLRETDYIKTPKDTGYRSLHLVLEVPVYLSEGRVQVPVEVQIRTIAMDFWATLEHTLRYKVPDEVPKEISDELVRTAQDITALDERMQRIHDQVEALRLQQANQEHPIQPEGH